MPLPVHGASSNTRSTGGSTVGSTRPSRQLTTQLVTPSLQTKSATEAHAAPLGSGRKLGHVLHSTEGMVPAVPGCHAI